MPRRLGTTKRTTPKWARQENDDAVLAMLGNYVEGLRVMELYERVKGTMTKPTLFASIKRLKDKGSVQFDDDLKRYRITTRGLEDIRSGTVRRVMANAGIAYQPPFGDRLLNKALFSSLFIVISGPKPPSSQPSIGEGYLAGAKKQQESSPQSWLYYLVKYAAARKLIKTDSTNLTPQHLINIWAKMFPRPLEIVLTEYLNSEKLLQWLETSPEATATLRKALEDFPRTVLEVR